MEKPIQIINSESDNPLIYLLSIGGFIIGSILVVWLSVKWLESNHVTSNQNGLITVERQLEVRAAPSENEGVFTFTIPEKSKISRVRREGEWTLIMDLNGRVGYVKTQSLY